MKLFRRNVADAGLGARDYSVAGTAKVGLTASLEMEVLMGVVPMQHGFSNAVDRLTAAASGDISAANDVYAGLFEASNWLVSIADRAGDKFKLSPIQRGIRYARNTTHHCWASAVEYKEGRWVWRRTDVLPKGNPDPEGRADHMQQLAGQPVADAFVEIKPDVLQLPSDL